MLNIVIIFLLFIIYSVIGWLLEVVAVYPKEKKFVNRGFMIGPCCPIYGCGAVIMYMALDKYKDDIIVLMVLSAVICSILEYITSYIMEKIFKARWWDYSQRLFNINGRVCLLNAIAFSFLAYITVKIMTPFFLEKLNNIDDIYLYIIGSISFIIFVSDWIISFKAMMKFKNVTFELKKDNTREITEKVKAKLIEDSYIYKRIVTAFPNVRETLILKKEEIEKKLLEADKKRKEKIKVLKKIIKEKVESIEELNIVYEKREQLHKFINDSKVKEILEYHKFKVKDIGKKLNSKKKLKNK